MDDSLGRSSTTNQNGQTSKTSNPAPSYEQIYSFYNPTQFSYQGQQTQPGTTAAPSYFNYTQPTQNTQTYQYQYHSNVYYHQPANLYQNYFSQDISQKSPNQTSYQIAYVQQPQYSPPKLKEAPQINDTEHTHEASLKRSSGVLPVPKYVKPKICKTSLPIQSVSSTRVLKPKPQLASIPPGEPDLPARPPSPPNQPPTIHRFPKNLLPPPPSNQPPPPPSGPPQIPYHPKQRQNLLNQVLNNSLNSTKTYDYESSFNQSASSANNSVFNHTGTTNTLNDEHHTNYQQLLMSQNLYTFFDRKKQPPPPYPGKIAEEPPAIPPPPPPPIPYEQAVKFQHQSNGSSNSSFLSSASSVRTCSPQAFKFYMEQHAENVLKHHHAREFRKKQLEYEMTEANLPPEVKDQMRKMLRQKETNYLRLRRAKMNKTMFETLDTLGIGAFGQVDLVRKKDDPQRLYAMKILHKNDVFSRKQAAHVKAERDILAQADNEWVVKLFYSFQDDENLYFVMDYVPGGDLMSLLIKKEVFSEKLSQFYIGELTCAIESVHNLGFIHRDIKPDNILIDKNGHIKLTDFGLCTGFHWTHNTENYFEDDQKFKTKNLTGSDRRLMALSLVGTPNYIAPEILSRKWYTKSCDWWSVGVILYEMLIGRAPFMASSASEIQKNVINWKNTLRIPDEIKISPEAKDLIFKLCTDAEIRLGAEGIKAHSFFKGFDFGPNLRKSEAPYKPTIKHPMDTSNFGPLDTAALEKRNARIDEANRTRMQSRFTNSTYGSSNYRADYSDLSNSVNSVTSSNPVIYEFTFRRFFDEVPSENRFFLNGYDNDHELNDNSEHSNSFRSIIKSIQNASQTTKNETNLDKMDYAEIDEKQQQQLTNMMNTGCKVNDENSFSYQTDKLISETKKLQFKESTNCYTNETSGVSNENQMDSKETTTTMQSSQNLNTTSSTATPSKATPIYI